jgi:murein peptide amidase A
MVSADGDAMGNAAEVLSQDAGVFCAAGRDYCIPRIRFLGPSAGHEPVRLGLFSGVHGDEPAGPAALIEFIRLLREQPHRAAGYDLWIYPTVNPSGCENGRRENWAGKDLNREFWRDSPEFEVRIIQRELRLGHFDGLITLHADDTCEGHYGYSHGGAVEDSLLRPALLAAERVLPRDGRSRIDGFEARDGVICQCFEGILAPPPDQHPRPFNVIFETPASAALELQVAAHVAALDAVLATYRGYISYAQGL